MNDTTDKKDAPSETNTPIHKIRVGSISVSIWQNAFDKGKTTYRAALAKTYRNHQGNWVETGTFRADDLILVATVAKLAANWMINRENDS